MSLRYKDKNGNVIYIGAGGSSGGNDVWEGTAAEYEAEKDTIPENTIILINDDARLPSGAVVDKELNEDSQNAIANKPVAEALNVITENLTTSDGTEQFKYDKVDGKVGCWTKEAGTDVFVPFYSGITEVDTFVGSNYIIPYDCRVFIVNCRTDDAICSKFTINDKTADVPYYYRIGAGDYWNTVIFYDVKAGDILKDGRGDGRRFVTLIR